MPAWGIDQLELMLAANPGEPARPLRKVASGGELSRTMLALKTVLAAHDQVGTLVFDEIDANVGGRLGDVLGQKLAALGQTHQVICVTHLPQVASYARHQWTIRKARRGKRTTTTIEPAGRGRTGWRSWRACSAARPGARRRARRRRRCWPPPDGDGRWGWETYQRLFLLALTSASATESREANLALERFAAQFFPLRLLLVREDAQGLLCGGFTDLFHLLCASSRSPPPWNRLRSSFPASSCMVFTFSFCSSVSLRASATSASAKARPQLQRNLLDPLELLRLQDFADGLVIDLGLFLCLFLPVLPAQIARAP